MKLQQFFKTAACAALAAFVACLGLSLAYPLSASAHEDKADAKKYMSQNLTVSGAVENRLVLEVDDLRQFPVQQIEEQAITRMSGANAGKLEKFKGVRLRDILDKAVIISRDHNDVKKIVVIATATDGYKVVFSWSELFNSPVGEGVLVFFEKDGKVLADDEGRIAMISAKDLRTGPRHVKWLQAVEVKKIVD
ncbi:molybdopterin-dependent oxidoreductase [Undibacterium sp. TJN19]|uniref:molybdopterin-dependent oxidoreductase n=1 Tax=Undibacterium sp. TJN19 TaxID=3413055 RepID=UPI003BF20F11